MTVATNQKSTTENHVPLSRTRLVWKKLKTDRLGMIAFLIVVFYFLVALGVWLGLYAGDWDVLVTDGRMPPSANHWFGTNLNGQDVFSRAIYSTRVAFEIGFVVSFFSIAVGAVLGALAGYRNGSWIDECVLWLCSVLDCIPFYLFVAAVAFALQGKGFAMHVAMIATFWSGVARIIRGEFIKLKSADYVHAAVALGSSTKRVIFFHLLPNCAHILIIQTSLLFVLAIKTEVILSFLGLGVKDGISWGRMIAESGYEISSGVFNNFFAASGFMFVLVLSFNMFSDALQDALDPKKVG
jgi:ABC-type dipeptide/oligopeptide/nickel transport system permease subunit